MGDKNNFKKHFSNIYCQIINTCKIATQEADNQYKKGRNDAFDDVLQWYNQISENGEKLVTVNQIIMYIQEKLEKTNSSLNLDDNNSDMKVEDNSDLGRLFSFPKFE